MNLSDFTSLDADITALNSLHERYGFTLGYASLRESIILDQENLREILQGESDLRPDCSEDPDSMVARAFYLGDKFLVVFGNESHVDYDIVTPEAFPEFPF